MSLYVRETTLELYSLQEITLPGGFTEAIDIIYSGTTLKLFYYEDSDSPYGSPGQSWTVVLRATGTNFDDDEFTVADFVSLVNFGGGVVQASYMYPTPPE